MSTIQGTCRDGVVILDAPAELPDGTRVTVVPFAKERPTLGMREQDWPTTPEGIAALLARMDCHEHGWLSPADDEAWREALKAQKELEKNRFFENADKLRGMWELGDICSIPDAPATTFTDATASLSGRE